MCKGAHTFHEVVKDPQFSRFIIALILLIIVMYWEGMAMTIADNRAHSQGVITNTNFYLTDLGQDIIRDIFGPNFAPKVNGFNNYVTVGIILATILFFFALSYWPTIEIIYKIYDMYDHIISSSCLFDIYNSISTSSPLYKRS